MLVLSKVRMSALIAAIIAQLSILALGVCEYLHAPFVSLLLKMLLLSVSVMTVLLVYMSLVLLIKFFKNSCSG